MDENLTTVRLVETEVAALDSLGRSSHINIRSCLTDIPADAENYKISGRSPLRWAIGSLRVKRDTDSGIVDDPSGWHEWADEPFNPIWHLRRLVAVSGGVGTNLRRPPSLAARYSATD